MNFKENILFGNMNNFDLDNKNDVFITPIKQRKEIVIVDAPKKNKIIFCTPTRKIRCEFNENNPLLLAPKKKKMNF